MAADVLERAVAWGAEGRGVALATVVRTWGSSPRPAGSQLAVSDDGEFVGSVSGGCVEGAVVEAALEVIRGAPPRRLEFGVTDEMAWEVGLACGGQVEIYVQAAPLEEIARVQGDRAAKRPVVLGIDLASGSCRVLHAEDAAAAREALARDRSAPLEGEGGDTFLRAYNPPLRLAIVGAVHIAQPLATMAAETGYEVTVIDPRTAFASEARFPGTTLVTRWPDEALETLGLDARTAVVTLTHDPKLDDPGLAAALRSNAFYVGALGSRRTQAARAERLRDAGFSDADIERVSGPVGLDIGARSPAEIAVSILAEMTARLRGAGA